MHQEDQRTFDLDRNLLPFGHVATGGSEDGLDMHQRCRALEGLLVLLGSRSGPHEVGRGSVHRKGHFSCTRSYSVHTDRIGACSSSQRTEHTVFLRVGGSSNRIAVLVHKKELYHTSTGHRVANH